MFPITREIEGFAAARQSPSKLLHQRQKSEMEADYQRIFARSTPSSPTSSDEGIVPHCSQCFGALMEYTAFACGHPFCGRCILALRSANCTACPACQRDSNLAQPKISGHYTLGFAPAHLVGHQAIPRTVPVVSGPGDSSRKRRRDDDDDEMDTPQRSSHRERGWSGPNSSLAKEVFAARI